MSRGRPRREGQIGTAGALAIVTCLAATLPAAGAPPARSAGSGGGSGEAGALVRRVGLMGTTLTLRIEADDRPAALAASEAAVRALEATERRLSTWRPESDLSRLNRAPVGAAVPLSPETVAELRTAGACREWTAGAFEPGIGALVAAWGLRTGGRLPSGEERLRALAAGGFAALELGSAAAVRRHPDLLLEEGGFGKGAGLDRAVAALAGRGVRALLDLGGQVAVVGGGTWPIAVADPARREVTAALLSIDAGSVATSGNSERGITAGGRRLGHLLDPRSGAPALDFGSVTVWAPSGLVADCLATGFYVLGPEAALARGAAMVGVEVLVLETKAGELRARATPGLVGRLAGAGAREIEIWQAGARPGVRDSGDSGERRVTASQDPTRRSPGPAAARTPEGSGRRQPARIISDPTTPPQGTAGPGMAGAEGTR